MAQTNFTPISLYYSSTATNVPTAGNLVDGELAINTADGKLFYKDSAGVVQTIATKDATDGTYSSITTNQLTIGTTQLGAGDSSMLKNRIINGAMVIDQRNAGASVTVNDAGLYTLDRWSGIDFTDGAFTVQQVIDAPSGFVNSLKVTVTTADASLGASQVAAMRQAIEGFNVADLGFGTANAKTVTLSFWVKSSLTGTFGGALENGAQDRSYPFTYTISAANTWEQKSVTVAGDTSGTWLTNNGVGLRVNLGLGAGSSFSGTAGAWTGADLYSATGATSVIGTSGATWYVTGVQLEVGTQATSFEYRQYQQELDLCSRYFTVLASGSGQGVLNGFCTSTTAFQGLVNLPVEMRTTPTLSASSGSIYYTIYTFSANSNITTVLIDTGVVSRYAVSLYTTSAQGASGLTGGQGGLIYTRNAASFVAVQAEL
jgi:hypothetical protein